MSSETAPGGPTPAEIAAEIGAGAVDLLQRTGYCHSLFVAQAVGGRRCNWHDWDAAKVSLAGAIWYGYGVAIQKHWRHCDKCETARNQLINTLAEVLGKRVDEWNDDHQGDRKIAIPAVHEAVRRLGEVDMAKEKVFPETVQWLVVPDLMIGAPLRLSNSDLTVTPVLKSIGPERWLYVAVSGSALPRALCIHAEMDTTKTEEVCLTFATFFVRDIAEVFWSLVEHKQPIPTEQEMLAILNTLGKKAFDAA